MTLIVVNMVVGARRAVFAADLLQFVFTTPQPSVEFTLDASKQRKHPVSCSGAEENALLIPGVRGQDGQGLLGSVTASRRCVYTDTHWSL